MSDWGDDEYTGGIEAEPLVIEDGDLPLPRPLGMDVGELAARLVDDAVRDAVHKQVASIAAAAVKDALTPELVESLQARAAVAATAAVSDDAEAAAPIGAGEDAAPELYYGSVDEFVREYLCVVYRRPINGNQLVWAADWWRYTEAVVRLEALWRSWEHLRLDPATGMSVWLRDHADHHMAVLMDPRGPFAGAPVTDEKNRVSKGKPLPYEPPPEGMFPDVRGR